VHTPSAFVAREVVELLGADAGRVVAVASGVPAGPADASGRGALASGPADASGRGALAGLGSWPYVLALGTIEPRKDLPALVRAFDAIADDHRDLRLVVAGADGWGSAPFDEAVARAAHRDRVVRLGYVTDAARGALLAGARVFAFPSRYEGFGFPPLEAMAAGVPVVATAAGALPEVLGDAAALVSPGDDDALASGLAVVLDDDARRDRLVRAGMARAAHYSWTSCAAGLVELYRRAVCERGG
jgi:alpha-1,3-rhamnosyl/mannosyltransferase